jgi:alkylation response protein AidB-like acyl-CoA dehydrogenase
MDFELNEEQRMLKESVERFVADHYSFEQRSALVSKESGNSELGYSREHWQLFADMGWLALPFGSEYGGMGGTPVESAIIMQALGSGLVLEPYLGTVIMGGGLISRAGSELQKETLLSQVISGDLTLAFAYLEPQSRFNPADVETRVERSERGLVLNGHKSVVYQGNSADSIIVSARSGASPRDREGISLLLLQQGMNGVTRKDFKTVDGQWASEFFFEDVALPAEALLGEEGQAIEAIEHTLDRVISAICAEAVGAMIRANDIARDYILVREQFGAAIGSFQALQHRWVDMYMEAEMAKSMSDVLAMRLRDGDEDSAQMVAAAKVRVGAAGLMVGEGAAQLHGGIGMTNECAIGHYYKRLMMIDQLFGSREDHSRRYDELQGVA